MNHYGLMAKEHWYRADRARYLELEDPEEFFSDLGEQIAAQVTSICLEMERNPPTDEEYLQTVGRLNAIRRQAEEIVFNDLMYIEPHPATVDEEQELLEMQRPSEEQIQDSLTRLKDREMEMSSDEYDERTAALEAMRNPV